MLMNCVISHECASIRDWFDSKVKSRYTLVIHGDGGKTVREFSLWKTGAEAKQHPRVY